VESRPVSKTISERSSQMNINDSSMSQKSNQLNVKDSDKVIHMSEKSSEQEIQITDRSGQMSVKDSSKDIHNSEKGSQKSLVQTSEKAEPETVYEFEQHHVRQPVPEQVEVNNEDGIEMNIKSSVSLQRSAEEIEFIKKSTRSFIDEMLSRPVEERGKINLTLVNTNEI
jgi:hypothetical protein